MNDELVNTAYVVKARCAKDVNGKKGVYLVKNSGISFYSGVRFCRYCLYYGKVNKDFRRFESCCFRCQRWHKLK